jgi:hypothetical protein
MVITHHYNSGQNHKLLDICKSIENVAELKYMGTTINKISIAITKKLRADSFRKMFAITQFRIFSFPVSSLKT